MVRACHLIISCYGFWFPNEPRGSWSDEVRKYELRPFGQATKVQTRQSLANQKHNLALRNAAKAALKHPPVRLTGPQARAAARGFTEVATTSMYHVHACAIMPDHTHIVTARHALHSIERITRCFKAKATQQLNKENLGLGHSPWAKGSWQVFLNSPEDVRRAIRYVEVNPVKGGMKRQAWKFVVPYEGG